MLLPMDIPLQQSFATYLSFVLQVGRFSAYEVTQPIGGTPLMVSTNADDSERRYLSMLTAWTDDLEFVAKDNHIQHGLNRIGLGSRHRP